MRSDDGSKSSEINFVSVNDGFNLADPNPKVEHSRQINYHPNSTNNPSQPFFKLPLTNTTTSASADNPDPLNFGDLSCDENASLLNIDYCLSDKNINGGYLNRVVKNGQVSPNATRNDYISVEGIGEEHRNVSSYYENKVHVLNLVTEKLGTNCNAGRESYFTSTRHKFHEYR